MITAARRLFREHGYTGTALSDVIAESAAPRGSMYFHFPGGKEELAVEVSLRHGAEAIAHVNRVAGTTDTAAQFIAAFVSRYRDEIVASDYREGCAVAPIVIESTPASASLTDVTRRLFQDIVATMAARLEEKAVPPEQRQGACGQRGHQHGGRTGAESGTAQPRTVRLRHRHADRQCRNRRHRNVIAAIPSRQRRQKGHQE